MIQVYPTNQLDAVCFDKDELASILSLISHCHHHDCHRQTLEQLFQLLASLLPLQAGYFYIGEFCSEYSADRTAEPQNEPTHYFSYQLKNSEFNRAIQQGFLAETHQIRLSQRDFDLQSAPIDPQFNFTHEPHHYLDTLVKYQPLEAAYTLILRLFLIRHSVTPTIEKRLKNLLPYLMPHFHALFNQPGDFNQKKLCAPKLTQREQEVIHWLLKGKSGWEIAKIIGKTQRTVKFHLANIYLKLNAENRTQAIIKALYYWGEDGFVS